MADPLKPEDESGLAPERAGDETFVSRWSRLKRRSNAGEDDSKAVTARADAPATGGEAPPMPPVDQLTPESDFSPFMHPKADPALRRVALKKLFSDPHFNVMDGLDTYIDDYNTFEPIGEELLANLSHAAAMLRRFEEPKPEQAPAEGEGGSQCGVAAENGRQPDPPSEETLPAQGEARPAERIKAEHGDNLYQSDSGEKET